MFLIYSRNSISAGTIWNIISLIGVGTVISVIIKIGSPAPKRTREPFPCFTFSDGICASKASTCVLPAVNILAAPVSGMIPNHIAALLSLCWRNISSTGTVCSSFSVHCPILCLKASFARKKAVFPFSMLLRSPEYRLSIFSHSDSKSDLFIESSISSTDIKNCL